MTDPIDTLSNSQIQTPKKETNIESIDTQIQKNAYIDKSLQTSREGGSKEQSQKIRMPYRNTNHKN